MRLAAITLPLLFACFAAASAGEASPGPGDDGRFPAGELAVDAAGRPLAWRGEGIARASVVEEAGGRILRLAAEAGPRRSWELTTALAVPAGWCGVRLEGGVRAFGIRPGSSPSSIPRLVLRAVDAAGAVLGDAAVLPLDGDQPWTAIALDLHLPAAAARIEIIAALNGALGACDLRDLRLQRRGALGAARTAPEGHQPGWGREPVEELSPQRARQVLNGWWRFAPAAPGDPAPPAEGWGWARVPCSWTPFRGGTGWALPGIAVTGDAGAWRGFGPDAPAAWYERGIDVPAAWAGRVLDLDFERVSTAAAVLLDGRPCGRIEWPGGALVLGTVAPGPHRLAVRVEAGADPLGRQVMIGVGQSKQEAAPLALRGLIGDVVLASRPAAARIDGVAVQPSVRRREIALDVELAGVEQAGTVAFTARMLGPDGREEVRFAASAPVQAAAWQSLRLAWRWPEPRLWDLDRPELYTLRLAAHGAGLADEVAETFGFREFRVGSEDDGPGPAGIPARTRLLLNERDLRLRPGNVDDYASFRRLAPETVRGWLTGTRQAGFNLLEVWPRDFAERGTADPRPLLYAEADRLGLPLFGALPDPRGFIYRLPAWEYRWEDGRAGFAQAVARELRRARNHPSVVGWVCGVNLFGHDQDQNPRLLGRSAWSRDEDAAYRQRQAAGAEAFAIVRGLDPTRPVYAHMGGQEFGDLSSTNHYLGLTPLQEREEWPAFWARQGDKPYIAVEFGLPLSATFNRGRADGGYWGRREGGAAQSEPLVSEFCAGVLGARAYDLEPAWYRDLVRAHYLEGQLYRFLPDALIHHPAAQELAARWVRATWLSWRTQGLSGGMVPWNILFEAWHRPLLGPGMGGWPTHLPSPWQTLAEPAPGRRGPWWPALPQAELAPFQAAGGFVPLPAGAALLAAQRETLAWIAGAAEAPYPLTPIPACSGAPAAPPPPAWLGKDHHVLAGGRLAKSVALVNDARVAQPWRAAWRASLGGVPVAQGELAGELPPAGIAVVPFAFACPAGLATAADGAIDLVATVGGEEHRDHFAWRAWPAAAPAGDALAVFDPEGASTRLLARLGAVVSAWDGVRDPGPVLVVGRHALETAEAGLYARLDAAVRAGTRVLVMAQDPAWLRARWGLRVDRQLSRQAFPLPGPDPLLAGFDAEALRDWAGEGTLVEPYPFQIPWEDDLDLGFRPTRSPPFGWRWGARGTVSSAAVEKPHLGGWRPLLESGFDLASSPLMELDLGAGALLLCTLDLDGRTADDPAALEVGRRLLAWLRTPRPARPARTVYLGDAAGRASLDRLGVEVDAAAGTPADTLLIAGPGADPALALAHADAGGRVVVLARTASDALVQVERRSDALPDRQPPAWPLARGLGAGDLRWRLPVDAWLLAPAPGVEVAAGGQLGRRRVGAGELWLCQLDPERFPADTQTFHRLTRWRQTRALSQMLANAGARFAVDRTLLPPRPAPPPVLPLAGTWQAAVAVRIPTVAEARQAVADPGLSAAAERLLAPAAAGAWEEHPVPGAWEGWGGAWAGFDGEAVLRRRVLVPAALAGRDLELSLGTIDDVDAACWDGVTVGATGRDTPAFWAVQRRYRIPARLATAGEHLLAVRVWDGFGNGGFTGRADQLSLRAVPPPAGPAWYHPDYRSDFILGDDPARYQRW